jgi:hypothetical protein
MKFKVLAILLSSLTISTSASAVNLIANGDFSGPFSPGFTSQYTEVTVPGATAMYQEATYAIGTNPIAYHDLFVDLGQNANNPMLLVNGATGGGDNLAVLTYQSNLLVAGNYVFSAEVMNICCNPNYTGGNGQSQLLFQISQDNGATWDDIASYTTSPPGDAGIASLVNSSFVALSAFTFRIIDAKTEAGGNDFAIDNLSIEAAAVPGPIAGAGLPGLVIALGGLVALARRRRNQAAVA